MGIKITLPCSIGYISLLDRFGIEDSNELDISLWDAERIMHQIKSQYDAEKTRIENQRNSRIAKLEEELKNLKGE